MRQNFFFSRKNLPIKTHRDTYSKLSGIIVTVKKLRAIGALCLFPNGTIRYVCFHSCMTNACLRVHLRCVFQTRLRQEIHQKGRKDLKRYDNDWWGRRSVSPSDPPKNRIRNGLEKIFVAVGANRIDWDLRLKYPMAILAYRVDLEPVLQLEMPQYCIQTKRDLIVERDKTQRQKD